MPRPFAPRRVEHEPEVTYFKPSGVPLRDLEEVELTIDELEALRLANLEKLSQQEAAARMGVHQSTFHRTILRAREKLTEALVNGKAIRIEGGVLMPRGDGTGPPSLAAGRRGAGGMGRFGGRMGGPLAAGPGGNCRCPQCGNEQMHGRGLPCNRTPCPKCGAMMVRA